MDDQIKKIIDYIPENFHRFTDPDLNRNIKLSLAKGAIPIPPDILTCILYIHYGEDDVELKESIEKRIKSIPVNLIVSFAENEKFPPPVLSFLYNILGHLDAVTYAVASNPATPVDTILRIIEKTTEPEILDIIADNQQRMKEHPEIIKALLNNTFISVRTSDKVYEFAKRNSIDIFKQFEEEKDSSRIKEAMAIASEIEQEKEEDKEEVAHFVPDKKKKEEDKKKSANLYKIIKDMTIAEKIKLAMLGNKSARRLLLKESNKVILMAVVKSPKISESEILEIAKNKTMNSEIIRFICSKKEWIKSYKMKLALVTNPKTPVDKALTFLSFLRKNDLKDIARSKNVPRPVAQAAQKKLKLGK